MSRVAGEGLSNWFLFCQSKGSKVHPALHRKKEGGRRPPEPPRKRNNVKIYYNNYLYFQSDIQAPLNRQILQSSETIMYLVKLSNNFFDYFMGGASSVLGGALKGEDSTDNLPRSGSGSGLSFGGFDVVQIFDFLRTLYNYAK